MRKRFISILIGAASLTLFKRKLFTRFDKKDIQATPEQGNEDDHYEDPGSEHQPAMPQPVFLPVQPFIDEPKAEVAYADSQQQIKPSPSERRTRRPDLRTTLSVLTLVVIMIHAALYYHQWRAMMRQSEVMSKQADLMAKQLESMNQSSGQTERLVAANESLARQNGELVAVTRNMAEQNRELVGHAGEQAQASLEQAEATRRSAVAAEQGVRSAARSAQMAMSPILDVKYITLVDAVSSRANPINVTVGIGNSGRTPAIKARFYLITAFSNDPQPPPFPPPSTTPDEVIIPSDMVVISRVATAEIKDWEWDRMVKDKLRLFVWGKISYEDIFGHRYYREFCYENLSVDKTTFRGCPPGYNTFK